MKDIWIVGAAALTGLLAIGIRLILSAMDRDSGEKGSSGCSQADAAAAQTIGNKEIQSDRVEFMRTVAGTMAVLADGIGNRNTGKLCAQLTVDTILDSYEPYHVLHNPEYFSKQLSMRRTAGSRRRLATAGAGQAPGWCF